MVYLISHTFPLLGGVAHEPLTLVNTDFCVLFKGVLQYFSLQADHVKLGAASLTSDDMEAQLLLLTAVKDVALSLGDLVGATRTASGKSVQDPSMENLKGSAKVGGA